MEEHREVWFIYSPVNAPWGNLRIATFTKAVNAPHLDLVVIHNDYGPRLGVRVWDDIVKTELWFKVRQIEVPSAADVMAASLRENVAEAIDTSEIPEATEDWLQATVKRPGV
jgi:hypothetical protein